MAGVAAEHRHGYDILNLRIEARNRAGRPVAEQTRHQVEVWKQRLVASGMVLDYDQERGFVRVPRRPGVDEDLIWVPERKTTARKAAN